MQTAPCLLAFDVARASLWVAFDVSGKAPSIPEDLPLDGKVINLSMASSHWALMHGENWQRTFSFEIASSQPSCEIGFTTILAFR